MNTIFLYSFLEGSLVYSHSHSSLKKNFFQFFSCALAILKQSDRMPFLVRIVNARFVDIVILYLMFFNEFSLHFPL